MSRVTLMVSIITVLSAAVLFANEARSQNLAEVSVNLNRRVSTVHELLADLARQTDFTFVYTLETGRIKLESPNIAYNQLDAVLLWLAKTKKLNFEQVNKSIAISSAQERDSQQTGRISGKVLDDRGEALLGASIKILQTNQSVQSSVDGSYHFSTTPGSYTLEFSYVSFQTKRITQVEVKSGQLTSLNITLSPSTSTLKQVVVTGSYKKESVAGLYATQKNAASVTDGISAEQIARTPDNDMGQVLKRVTGLTTVNNRSVIVRGMSDRYNQAMLDGIVIPSTSQNRRDFSFDIIPTEMVSSVVVNKTATPDVSAEFSGGQVSVNTIDIPEQSFTSIQVGTGGNSSTTGKDFYRLGERHTSEYLGFFDKSAKLPEGIKTWQWNNRASQLDAPPGYILDDPELNNTPLNPIEFGDAIKYNELDAIAQSKRLNSDAMRLYKYKATPNQNIRFSLGRRYELKNGDRFGFVASANFRNEQNIVSFNNVRRSPMHHYIDSTGLGDNGAG
ncbi:MAG: TonB-dependent receptor, partial [Sphingobacterium sp.]|nr:TonB-dependent receptor [Sphingobacterium sp.]